ncbi:MAG: BMC domain-containing protein [Dehalococcoidia bacterium]|jgi:microcompartment protein CcmL/EutN|nr:BMC domain-containing protein [Dehalococcoidia bacterium]MDP7469431.1 BMC domain-containing protein [Dehalococcoidia bacterium]
MPREALGALEVYGFPPFLEAADAALKAADVVPVRTDSAGIGLLCLYVQGDVGAVRTAVEAGTNAASRSSRAMSMVLANPQIGQVSNILGTSQAKGSGGQTAEAQADAAWGGSRPMMALGSLQSDGVLPLVESADAMLKAANVQLFNYRWIGLRNHTLCLSGEIGDARTALDVGVQTAQRTSGEVYGSLLANPFPLLFGIIGAEPGSSEGSGDYIPSLGILETKGLAASSEGSDAMFKASRVKPVKFIRAGLAWLVTFVTGELGSVQTAIESGQAAASQKGESQSTVIPNPHPDLLPLFGIEAQAQ